MVPDGGRQTRDGVLLIAITLLAYANSFHGLPQFDDYSVILDNPAVASVGAWWGSMPGIRALLKLSYALNRSIDGLMGMHLVNLLLHLCNVLLGWRLLRRLLNDSQAMAALMGAAAFALHPVNTEAVTMLSGRSVTLSTAFMLASMLGQLRGLTLLSLVCFALAMACRETALALAPLLTLVFVWRAFASGARTIDACREAGQRTRWHWLLSAIAPSVLMAVPDYRDLLAFSLQIRPPLENLLAQAQALCYLLGQLFRPFAMNADPDLSAIQPWSAVALVAVGGWLALLGWSVSALPGRNYFAFCVLWFLAAMAPGSSLLARLDVANERQLYLAALPLYALLAVLLQRLDHAVRLAGPLVASTVLLTLAVATWLRNTDYYSETAFWRDVVAKSPRKSRPWNNLGFALDREHADDPVAILAAYERAIALDPDDYKPRFNRLVLCRRIGCKAE